MKRTMMLLLAAWSFVVLSVGDGHAAPAHDFAGRCQGCHLSDPLGSPLIFVGGLEHLCRECHPIAQGNAHPSGVTPSSPLPAEFLWDPRGDLDAELSCATCHAPHADADGNPLLLRGEARGQAFCQRCHSEAVTAAGQHFAASSLAHPRTAASALTASESSLLTLGDATIDPVSAECLTCHDGSGGPHASFCLLLQKGQGCGGHIVSADYASLANAKPEKLNPAAAVEGTLALYAGEITCLTCHSIYSHEGMMLAVGNRGSALCFVCHKK